MVISIPGQCAYVLESATDYLLMLGIVDSATFSTVIVLPFIVPDPIMVFPLTYLTNYTSSSLLDETFFYDDFFGTLYVDSIRLRFDAETHSSVFADKTEVVDVRNWPAGLYVLRWMTDNRRIAETKLIVQ